MILSIIRDMHRLLIFTMIINIVRDRHRLLIFMLIIVIVRDMLPSNHPWTAMFSPPNSSSKINNITLSVKRSCSRTIMLEQKEPLVVTLIPVPVKFMVVVNP